MVGIGIVGIGFMGWIHSLAICRMPAARLAAIATRDARKRAGDWTGVKGNFGPEGGPVDLAGVGAYSTLDELLADPAVDLVDLCTPTDEHAPMAIRALEAGKHVLVEKPIALEAADADAMVAAARASGRLLMVGHVLPFFPEFAFAREAVASGRYGKLVAAHLTRVIARPEGTTGLAETDRTGGPAIDLHIHDTHFVDLICGPPRAVQSRGVVEGGTVVYLSTQYLYDDPNLAVSAVSGAIGHAGRSFRHGFELSFERATLAYEYASMAGAGHLATPLSVIRPDGTIERPEPGGSGDPVDGFVAELSAAVGAVESGRPDPRLAAETARRALLLCRAEIRSVVEGRTIEVDGGA